MDLNGEGSQAVSFSVSTHIVAIKLSTASVETAGFGSSDQATRTQKIRNCSLAVQLVSSAEEQCGREKQEIERYNQVEDWRRGSMDNVYSCYVY